MNTEFSIGDVKFDFDHNDVLDVTQVKSDTHQVTLVTFDYSQSNNLKLLHGMTAEPHPFLYRL